MKCSPPHATASFMRIRAIPSFVSSSYFLLLKEIKTQCSRSESVPPGFTGAIDSQHRAACLITPNPMSRNMIGAGVDASPSRLDLSFVAASHPDVDQWFSFARLNRSASTDCRHMPITLKIGPKWKHFLCPIVERALSARQQMSALSFR